MPTAFAVTPDPAAGRSPPQANQLQSRSRPSRHIRHPTEVPPSETRTDNFRRATLAAPGLTQGTGSGIPNGGCPVLTLEGTNTSGNNGDVFGNTLGGWPWYNEPGKLVIDPGCDDGGDTLEDSCIQGTHTGGNVRSHLAVGGVEQGDTVKVGSDTTIHVVSVNGSVTIDLQHSNAVANVTLKPGDTAVVVNQDPVTNTSNETMTFTITKN